MIKVIVAEDHAMFRDGLKRILGETIDIAIVAEAASGKEALKKSVITNLISSCWISIFPI